MKNKFRAIVLADLNVDIIGKTVRTVGTAGTTIHEVVGLGGQTKERFVDNSSLNELIVGKDIGNATAKLSDFLSRHYPVNEKEYWCIHVNPKINAGGFEILTITYSRTPVVPICLSRFSVDILSESIADELFLRINGKSWKYR